jgi:hypothetical protein
MQAAPLDDRCGRKMTRDATSVPVTFASISFGQNLCCDGSAESDDHLHIMV